MPHGSVVCTKTIKLSGGGGGGSEQFFEHWADCSLQNFVFDMVFELVLHEVANLVADSSIVVRAEDLLEFGYLGVRVPPCAARLAVAQCVRNMDDGGEYGCLG
jgi:hypothetical protein